MSDHSAIEWTDATWNPVTGCTKVSAGCDHCYAERITERFHGRGSFATVEPHPERLDTPLRWRRPRRVFVNSMSDLFHPDIPDSYITDVFAVMTAATRHTFQVLTKRHGRMRSLLRSGRFRLAVTGRARDAEPQRRAPVWPLGNVWLGVSAETQRWASIRVPALLDTPAAVRFVSCEPLLGPVDLFAWLPWPGDTREDPGGRGPHLDWVIAGGESGPRHRPVDSTWVRALRDQCAAADVPFHFKQWGGRTAKEGGRVLDGRTWDNYPPAGSAA
ncbi:MAG: DUF5131 family protein [Streptosporangiaceae bacterium]